MIYLDNASTTRPSDAAKKAVLEAMEHFGNPSSLHRLGIEGEKIIEPSRASIAAKLGADIATVPYSVIMQMIKHPLTDAGIEKFLKDWEGHLSR